MLQDCAGLQNPAQFVYLNKIVLLIQKCFFFVFYVSSGPNLGSVEPRNTSKGHFYVLVLIPEIGGSVLWLYSNHKSQSSAYDANAAKVYC